MAFTCFHGLNSHSCGSPDTSPSITRTLLLRIHANISKSNPTVFYPKESSLFSIFLHRHRNHHIYVYQFGFLKITFHLPIPLVSRSVSRLELEQCYCSQPRSSFSVLSQHRSPSYCYCQPKLLKLLLSEPSTLSPKGPGL